MLDSKDTKEIVEVRGFESLSHLDGFKLLKIIIEHIFDRDRLNLRAR